MAQPRSQKSFDRVKKERQCEFCGRRFMQTRWWQDFCSSECRKNSDMSAKFELREARKKIEELEAKLKEVSENSVAHFRGMKPEARDAFKYDDENQELMSLFEHQGRKMH